MGENKGSLHTNQPTDQLSLDARASRQCRLDKAEQGMRKEREEKCRDQASLKVLAARLSTAKAPGSAALVVAGLGGTCDGSVGEDLMEVLQAPDLEGDDTQRNRFISAMLGDCLRREPNEAQLVHAVRKLASPAVPARAVALEICAELGFVAERVLHDAQVAGVGR